MTSKDFHELMDLLDQIEEIVKLYPAFSYIHVNILNTRYELIKRYSEGNFQSDDKPTNY